MPRPLVSARWRAGALVAVLAAIALTAWLCVIMHDAGNTALDDWVLRKLVADLGPGGARLVLDVSQSQLSLGIILLVALGAALARNWPLLLLSAAGPGLAFVITEHVLKPSIGRYVALPGAAAATPPRRLCCLPCAREPGA